MCMMCPDSVDYCREAPCAYRWVDKEGLERTRSQIWSLGDDPASICEHLRARHDPRCAFIRLCSDCTCDKEVKTDDLGDLYCEMAACDNLADYEGWCTPCWEARDWK